MSSKRRKGTLSISLRMRKAEDPCKAQTESDKSMFETITLLLPNSPALEKLNHVKNRVIQVLNPTWHDLDLKHENIKLFLVCENKTRKEVVTGDITWSRADMFVAAEEVPWDNKTTMLVALEYFKKTPVDLFRKVVPDQVLPVTFTHPNLANQWTKVTPLYCAAFNASKQETSQPWFGPKAKSDIKCMEFRFDVPMTTNRMRKAVSIHCRNLAKRRNREFIKCLWRRLLVNPTKLAH